MLLSPAVGRRSAFAPSPPGRCVISRDPPHNTARPGHREHRDERQCIRGNAMPRAHGYSGRDEQQKEAKEGRYDTSVFRTIPTFYSLLSIRAVRAHVA